MTRCRRTKVERVRDKQAQLQGMAESNIALNYVNSRLIRKNKNLLCKLQYLETMLDEIVETQGEVECGGVIKIEEGV